MRSLIMALNSLLMHLNHNRFLHERSHKISNSTCVGMLIFIFIVMRSLLVFPTFRVSSFCKAISLPLLSCLELYITHTKCFAAISCILHLGPHCFTPFLIPCYSFSDVRHVLFPTVLFSNTGTFMICNDVSMS